MSLKGYYWLAKPGIVYGNTLSALAGFVFASRGQAPISLLLATMAGIALVIAGACVINNYTDRHVDKHMSRTRGRATARGTVTATQCMLYVGVLTGLGFGLLAWQTNWVTVVVGLIGFVDYIIFYAITKRTTIYGTLVGTIAGATPIVAGYTAVTGSFDSGAMLLGLIMVVWQLPHFYAIAVYRLADYKAAGIPVWPARRGVAETKRQIMLCVIAFTAFSLLLTILGYTGYVYFVIMLLLGLSWFVIGAKNWRSKSDVLWARQMFFFSLVAMIGLCGALFVGSFV